VADEERIDDLAQSFAAAVRDLRQNMASAIIDLETQRLVAGRPDMAEAERQAEAVAFCEAVLRRVNEINAATRNVPVAGGRPN
jgi:hypothetical protein